MDVPAVLEPPGLMRGDGKRPDGMTPAPWSAERSLVWDFICPDALVPSHLPKATFQAGASASASKVRKRSKYADISQAHIFIPVAAETFGA